MSEAVDRDPAGAIASGLAAAVGAHGPAVLSDPGSLENEMGSTGSGLPVEWGLVMSAADVDVAGMVTSHVRANVDVATAVRLAAQSLSALRPVEPDESMWVATAFAHALGYEPDAPRTMPAPPAAPPPPPAAPPPAPAPAASAPAAPPPAPMPAAAPAPPPAPPAPAPAAAAPAPEAAPPAPAAPALQPAAAAPPEPAPAAPPAGGPLPSWTQAVAGEQAQAKRQVEERRIAERQRPPTPPRQVLASAAPPAGPPGLPPASPAPAGASLPSGGDDYDPYQAEPVQQRMPSRRQRRSRAGGWAAGSRPAGFPRGWRHSAVFRTLALAVVVLVVFLILHALKLGPSLSGSSNGPAHSLSQLMPDQSSSDAAGSLTLSKCSAVPVAPSGLTGVSSSFACTDVPGHTGWELFAFQFSSPGDYQTSLAAYNRDQGFVLSSAGTSCPAPASQQGQASWSSRSYPTRAQQVVECFSVVRSGSSKVQPAYLWTLPSEDAFFEMVASPSSSAQQLASWWSRDGAPAAPG